MFYGQMEEREGLKDEVIFQKNPLTFFSNSFLEVKKSVSLSYHLFKDCTECGAVQNSLEGFVWKGSLFPAVLSSGNSHRSSCRPAFSKRLMV